MADALRQCSWILMSGGHRFVTIWHRMPPKTSSSFYWICRSPLEQQLRCYSSQGRRGFLAGLLDDIKQELSKNKEMKENIKKFREEAKKFEESDALQQARRKYKSIESETMKTSEVFRKKFEEITDTVKESIDEVGKSDLGRKIREGVEEAAKTAKHSAESVSKGGEKLGKTAAFKVISQGVESVKKEIDESILAQTGPYRPPSRLRKRSEFSGEKMSEEKIFEPNEESMGVVLHKDSKWHQQWKDFKDNNVVFNRFFEMKMKYDESDNALIRASRTITDKISDLFGGMFSKTEMSEVLTEIVKVDPNFDKDAFLKMCEKDIIPNILEAIVRGDLDVLKDWCYEATYSQLAHPIQQAKAMGLRFHSKVLDIDNIDLAMGKIMEQGPVLIITFQAQLVMVLKNQKGEVVEGDQFMVSVTGESYSKHTGVNLLKTSISHSSLIEKPHGRRSDQFIKRYTPLNELVASSAVHAPETEIYFSYKDKVLRMLYVWALCRDQDELNPYAAWRLLDISSSASEQIL